MAASNALTKLFVYQTTTKLYIIGQQSKQNLWRVLKIDRTSTQLELVEDQAVYTFQEVSSLLRQIHAGNLRHGGVQLVTKAYGIIGCFSFLEGYYLLCISKRRYVGSIAGHKVYGIAEKGLVQMSMAGACRDSPAERRYRKLLLTGMDLTKDFYFSYTYNLAQPLQTNFCGTVPLNGDMAQVRAVPQPFDSMFVWNEFLTRPAREALGTTRWVVSIIHGSFEQRTLSLFGRPLTLTLISRRSKYFAGTRYKKRGVNDQGHVANEVETEQLVSVEGAVPGAPPCMAACVQVRGSIPLFWSQEGSAKLKPDIIVQQYDPLYTATQAHFDDLRSRYGNPIVICDLVKQCESRSRETLLGGEFRAAVAYCNTHVPLRQRLQYQPFDLKRAAKQRDADLLSALQPIMQKAVKDTGAFVYAPQLPVKLGCAAPPTFQLQHGVLRTNCIDCLDRTNVGQFVYGFVALGHQLNALGLTDGQMVDRNSGIAKQLMSLYEACGHTIALQYGGSEAHSSFFQRARGDWEAATTSRDLLTSVRRFYSNAYTDAEKQDAINLFLGNFQPTAGQPHLWDLDTDYYLHTGRGRVGGGSDMQTNVSRPSSFFDFLTQEQVDTQAMHQTPLSTPQDVASHGSPHFAAQLDASSVSSSAVGLGPLTPPPPIPISMNPQLLEEINEEGEPDKQVSAQALATSLKAVNEWLQGCEAASPAVSPADRPDEAPKPVSPVTTALPASDATVNGTNAGVRNGTADVASGLHTAAAVTSAVGRGDCKEQQGAQEQQQTTSPIAISMPSNEESNGISSHETPPHTPRQHNAKQAPLLRTQTAPSVWLPSAFSPVNSQSTSQQTLWDSFGSQPSTPTNKKKKKWDSFDHMLSKRPVYNQQGGCGLFDIEAPKGYLPQWLTSPLGMGRRSTSTSGLDPAAESPTSAVSSQPASTAARRKAGAQAVLALRTQKSLPASTVPCTPVKAVRTPPTRPVAKATRPRSPPCTSQQQLRRTNSESRLQDLLAQEESLTFLQRQPSVLSPAFHAGSGLAGAPSGDLVVFSTVGLPQPSRATRRNAGLQNSNSKDLGGLEREGGLSGAPRRKRGSAFPFAIFRQPSRTLAAMNLDAPTKKGNSNSKAAITAPTAEPGAPPRGAPRRPPDIGDLLGALEGARSGRDDLGIPAELHGWWGVGPQFLLRQLAVNSHWLDEEAVLRKVYSSYIQGVLSLSFNNQTDSDLRTMYKTMCAPSMVVSVDGFASGAASKWRQQTGLKGTRTVTEAELCSITSGQIAVV